MFWLLLAVSEPQGVTIETAALGYHACVMTETERFIDISDEPAATIADAALGECADFEDMLRNATRLQLPTISLDRVLDIVAHQRATQRNLAIAEVLKRRSRKP